MSKFEEEIKSLVKLAGNESSSVDALRFSQAALNLTHAAVTCIHAEKEEKALNSGS